MAFTLKSRNKLLPEYVRKTSIEVRNALALYDEDDLREGRAKIVQVRIVETKRRKP